MNEEQNFPKNEDEWKKKLTPEEYSILREKGTEAPFTGEFFDMSEKGMFMCKGCGAKLFDSESKIDDSKNQTPGLAGWPAFESAVEGALKYEEDNSMGMTRVEVTCSKCGSHLGHLFTDDTTSTGQHFCINSISLKHRK